MATHDINVNGTIANDAVTNAKLANMAAGTHKGRAIGAGTGDPQDLTPDQSSAILDTATDPLMRTSDAVAAFDPLTQNRPNNTTPDLSFHYFPVYDPGDAQSEKTDGVEIKAWLAGEFDALGAAAAAQAASQPLDADLTAIAELTPSNDDIIQRKAGAWTNRSMSQLATDLAGGIRSTLLTGLSLASSAAVAATDSILEAFGKLQAFNNLFTTAGLAIARLANPGAVTFLRINADNTVTSRTAAELRTDLGLGTAAQVDTGTGAANVPTITQADARYLTARPMGMHMASTVTWTNMPAAVSFLAGLPAANITKLMPLGGYTQIRLVLATGTVAGAASAKIYLRYRSTYSTTASDYLQIGSSEVQCAINSTGTGVDSGWIDLDASAIGDVYVTILGSGGDGVIDPVIGTCVMYVR